VIGRIYLELGMKNWDVFATFLAIGLVSGRIFEHQLKIVENEWDFNFNHPQSEHLGTFGAVKCYKMLAYEKPNTYSLYISVCTVFCRVLSQTYPSIPFAASILDTVAS